METSSPRYRFYRKLGAVVCHLSLLVNTFLPLAFFPISALAADEEIPTPTPEPTIVSVPEPTIEPTLEPTSEPTLEPTLKPTIEPTLEPTSEPTLEPTLEPALTPIQIGSLTPTEPASSPTPEPSVVFSLTPSPIATQECLTDQTVVDSQSTDWQESNGIFTTIEKVKLGVRYVFPGENKVSVLFKCLPTDESSRTTLKIQQIKTSDLKLPANINNVAEFAYDITTDMDDGDFQYDVTLPKPANQTAEISYLEKTVDQAKDNIVPDEIKTIDLFNTEQQSETVKASNIDHFTIFIATYSDTYFNVEQTQYHRNETVYTHSTGLTKNNSTYYRVDIVNPSNSSVSHSSCSRNIDTLDYSSTLSSSAPIGVGWKAVLSQFSSNSNCNSNSSPTGTWLDTFEVTATSTPTSLTNPSLANTCGLDIALVIDNSNSIDDGELSQMKTALTGFVNALSGTPTQFSVTRFGSSASVLQGFTSNTSVVNSAINSVSTGGGGTNWEDGFSKTITTFSPDPRSDKPNLIIFASDGNPTFPNCGGSSTCADDVNSAIVESNHAKQIPARILAIGIGDGLNVNNLKSISGPTVNSADISTADVITTDFSGMADKLSAFARRTCGGKISINKYVDGIQKSDGQTWSFVVDAGTTLTTDSNGQTVSGTLSVGNHSVSEISIPAGYSYDHASCTNGTADTNGVKDIAVTTDSIITCNFYNTTNKGSITIIKDAQPNNAQDFTFTTTGVGLTNFSLDDDSDNTLSNTRVFSNLMPGTYSVAENIIPGWTQTSATCSDGSSVNNISLQAGENITCTFLNTQQTGTLRIIKDVINDNGGTKNAGNFTLSIGNTSFNGSSIGTILTLSPGTYSVGETQLPGYTKTGDDCTNVVVTAGQEKTCTITNNDVAPTLTLLKQVNNLYNGQFSVTDWTLSAIGSTLSFSGKGNVGPNPVQAGIEYTLSESGPGGVTASSWSCSGGSLIGNKLTLSLGDNVTCTIINTAEPAKLIVNKVVHNNYGGTLQAKDFYFRLNGGTAIEFDADGQNDFLSLNNGTYDVTENTTTGYAVSYNNCQNLVIGNGETQTCTITNNDIQPKLTITKIVVNNHGGKKIITDFPLFVGTTQVTSGQQNGFNAGTYTISETNQPGYTSAIGGDCSADGSVTLKLGDVKSCTITNNDQPATLLVTKTVINDHGGNQVAADFTINVTGTNVSPASFFGGIGTTVTLDAGSYSVDETDITGYQKTLGTGCSGVIANGETKSCLITNNDAESSITLIKNVVNNYGGSAQSNDFNLSIGGTIVSSGQKLILNSNHRYSINEVGRTGYQFVSVTGDTKCPSVLGDSISLSTGENIACTITNNDIQPKLTITKVVVNDNGGTKVVSDFPLYVGATKVTSGQQNGFNSGTYLVREDSQSGYTSVISGDCNSQGEIILSPGDIKTCTITNDDITPKLTLVKTVVNDNGGTKVVSDFKLYIDGIGVTSGVAYPVLANQEIIVSEDFATGYLPSTWGGDCTIDGKITLLPGENKTCTITNDDIAPTLTVIKNVVNDNGGDATINDFGITLNDSLLTFGSGTTSGSTTTYTAAPTVVSNTNYTLSENTLDGYTNGFWNCFDNHTEKPISLPLLLTEGQNVTCTITNDDIAPKLTLIKTVTNNNGGSALPNDFKLTVGQTIVSSGVKNTYLANIAYLVNETQLAGYQFVSITGDKKCPSTLGGTITLDEGDDITCTITNDDIFGRVTVYKFNDLNGNGKQEEGEGNLSDWTINLTGQTSINTDISGKVIFGKLTPGDYDLSENLQSHPGWTQTNIYCEDNSQGVQITSLGEAYGHHGECAGWNDCDNAATCALWACESKGYSNLVSYGAQKPCTDFTTCNLFRSRGNVQMDWGNGCGVMGVTDIVCNNNSSSGRLTGKYSSATGIYRLTIGSGQNATCYIGNHLLPPRATISKINNVGSNNLVPGSSVEYRLKLKIFDNDVNNFQVTDLLSNGFKYQPGSYRVIKNDIDITASITEPAYHSPGVWNLGNLLANDIVELIYTANISQDQQPGIYTDLAYAYGQAAYNSSTNVIAASEIDGYVNENFVGTNVPIVKNTQQTVSAGVEKQETKTSGEVLGASTELPATGSNTIWLLVSFLLSIFGFAFMKFSKKIIVISFFFILSLSISPINAVSNLSVRVEQPKNPTNLNNVYLNFVALDIKGRPVTVQCFKKSPSESSFTQFGSNIDLTAGGNASHCDLSSILNTEGTYQFQIVASAGGDTASGPTISLDYKTSSPGTPYDYRKDHPNNCDYKIHFKTADDGGRTVKVELYRADITSFLLDSGSVVSSVSVGSNEERDITNSVPDCSKTYYYVLRAFDSAGNGSGTVGDSVTITTVVGGTSSSTSTTTTAGAIPVANVTLASESSLLTPENTASPEITSSPEAGTVLGAENEEPSFLAKYWLPTVLSLLTVAAIIAYVLKKKKK